MEEKKKSIFIFFIALVLISFPRYSFAHPPLSIYGLRCFLETFPGYSSGSGQDFNIEYLQTDVSLWSEYALSQIPDNESTEKDESAPTRTYNFADIKYAKLFITSGATPNGVIYIVPPNYTPGMFDEDNPSPIPANAQIIKAGIEQSAVPGTNYGFDVDWQDQEELVEDWYASGVAGYHLPVRERLKKVKIHLPGGNPIVAQCINNGAAHTFILTFYIRQTKPVDPQNPGTHYHWFSDPWAEHGRNDIFLFRSYQAFLSYKSTYKEGVYCAIWPLNVHYWDFYARLGDVNHRILFIHGDNSWPISFQNMATQLEGRGFAPQFFWYSPRSAINTLAYSLAFKDRFPAYTVVGHSLGGLLARRARNFGKGLFKLICLGTPWTDLKGHFMPFFPRTWNELMSGGIFRQLYSDPTTFGPGFQLHLIRGDNDHMAGPPGIFTASRQADLYYWGARDAVGVDDGQLSALSLRRKAGEDILFVLPIIYDHIINVPGAVHVGMSVNPQIINNVIGILTNPNFYTPEKIDLTGALNYRETGFLPRPWKKINLTKPNGLMCLVGSIPGAETKSFRNTLEYKIAVRDGAASAQAPFVLPKPSPYLPWQQGVRFLSYLFSFIIPGQATTASVPVNINAGSGFNPLTRSTAISWPAAAGAASYRVYRSTDLDEGYEFLGETSSAGLRDTYSQSPGENLEERYYYRVSAVDGNGVQSELSAQPAVVETALLFPGNFATINATIAYAYNNRIPVVKIRPGVYRESGIYMRPGVTVKGSGMNQTIIETNVDNMGITVFRGAGNAELSELIVRHKAATGIDNQFGTPDIIKVKFEGEMAAYPSRLGIGIKFYSDLTRTTTIRNCIFVNSLCGAMITDNRNVSQPTYSIDISNNVFTNNTYGAHIYGHSNTQPVIKNNIFSANFASIFDSSAYSAYLYNIRPVISLSTLAMRDGFDYSSVRYNDFFRDEFQLNEIIGFRLIGTPPTSRTPIYGGPLDYRRYVGKSGNIGVDPLFKDAAFHLNSTSPCIDFGDPSDDFSLEPLPNGNRINMGAYGNTPEAEIKTR
jgi:pimeloyl-ACP methyl ester carboxylesterase